MINESGKNKNFSDSTPDVVGVREILMVLPAATKICKVCESEQCRCLAKVIRDTSPTPHLHRFADSRERM